MNDGGRGGIKSVYFLLFLPKNSVETYQCLQGAKKEPVMIWVSGPRQKYILESNVLVQTVSNRENIHKKRD